MAEAERVRWIYDKLAPRYDADESGGWEDTLRALAFPLARGDVLELGVGTGATFAHYPPDLASLTGLDISEGMLAQARRKAAALPFPVTLRVANFQTLPFADTSFDTVTSSLALCGIPDPLRLYAEIRRVMRPGGRLLAVEHIRPPNPLLGLLADLGDRPYNHFVGCHLNRRTPELLRQAGYTVEILRRQFVGAGVALVATPPTAPARSA
jgi:ubiquinone/menaquinone biosynthesis C-methylase UbiE